MKSNINTTIIEQSGELGKIKASTLSGYLVACLSVPEMLEEVNRRIAAEKKEKEAAECH
ncbi:MAG: hypothetical protein K2I93_03975 [Oscillospiraceae bacterium]|nr:hypothetical protein [Oscillospiraceae bacterium]